LNSESAPPRAKVADYLIISLGVFALYWTSSFLLVAHKATIYFGADTWHYAELAKPDVFGKVAGNELLDRIARFHPLTMVLAIAWMKTFSLFEAWIAPLQILRAMSAAAGALGVAGALAAFNTYLCRRDAILCTLVYAASFGVWYFSSIEESKIITASLVAIYIACYLRIRMEPKAPAVLLLTLILLLGCLNEIVFAFIVILTAIDAGARHGLCWRRYRWIFLHLLTVPFALIVFEGLRIGFLPQVVRAEGTSLFDLFFYYFTRNAHGFAALYEFAVNWVFFSIAAPSQGVTGKGYFDPSLANYLSAPAALVAIAISGVMILAAVVPRYRAGNSTLAGGLWLGLAVFSLVRGAFFYVFNPAEPLLFSAAVTLPHLMMLLIPFAASRFPGKHWLIAAFAALLAANNGLFMLYA
jgi:hypothetical protein